MDIYNSHVRKVISALYRLICDYHDRQTVRPLSPDLEAVWQRSMAHFKKSIQCMDYIHNRTVNDPIWHAAIKRGEADNLKNRSTKNQIIKN